ncbi:hypothetical protein E2C01_023938 [Portunus trituberculatus]|uniref:Uncharacterized protein n=1 Tax=Portunus trituberculatus TaxID=210409 RepID=A0A5B7E969_PORTR|nr:hypothetical protein [Portunus trituberculatus]
MAIEQQQGVLGRHTWKKNYTCLVTARTNDEHKETNITFVAQLHIGLYLRMTLLEAANPKVLEQSQATCTLNIKIKTSLLVVFNCHFITRTVQLPQSTVSTIIKQAASVKKQVKQLLH